MTTEIKTIVPAGADDCDPIDRGLVTLTEAIEQCGIEVSHGFLWGTYGYGAKYENDVFWMIPDYQDAECNCGHHERAERWHEVNQHLGTCYYKIRQSRIREWEIENNWDAIDNDSKCDVFEVNGRRHATWESAQSAWRSEAGEFHSFRSPTAEVAFQAWCKLYDQRDKAEDVISKSLCKEFDIPWNNGWGAAVHCTCGVDERAKKWFSRPENQHARMCVVAAPNFWHKRTGVEVRWYKWIGRDQKVDAPEGTDWNAIFNECLASLRP